MRTERLYNDNPYLKEFDAMVIETIPFEGKYGIVLDRTAFYPEGGGQPFDTGYLNDSRVLQVIEKNGEILHIVDNPLQSKEVKGLVDWSRRFDHMQQHTGQHILSACFEKLFGGSTDSFHLGKDIVSIEINIDSFSEKDAEQVENMANDIIYRNLPVKARIVSEEELKDMPLRKKPTVSENIRIMEIKEFDYSPCGGTHVSTTGEVGIIKIKSWEKCKGGHRFIFLCGYRALRDYGLQNSIIKSVGEKLSVRDHEITDAVSKLLYNCKAVEKKLSAATQELMKFEAERILRECPLIGSIKLVRKIIDGGNINDARLLAQHLVKEPGTIALLACRNENAQVIFARSEDVDMDMNNLLKAVFPIIDGKGGGNARMAQGGGSRADKLDELMDTAISMMNL